MPSSATARTAAAAARSVSPSLGRTTTPEAPRACCCADGVDETPGRGPATRGRSGRRPHRRPRRVPRGRRRRRTRRSRHPRPPRCRRGRPRGTRVSWPCSSVRRVMRTRCGSAGLDAGLDGRAGVVDVGVDVPLAVAADDEHRVAELDEAGAQRVHGGVVGVAQEVHHLELRDALDLDATGRSRRAEGRAPGVGSAPGAAVRGVGPGAGPLTGADPLEALEEHDEPGSPGVDDTGAGEHLELLGRVLERHTGGLQTPRARRRARSRAHRLPRGHPRRGHGRRRTTAYGPGVRDPAACAAASAIARATVRIVPSLGSVTAWRARCSACCRPSARTRPSISATPAQPSARPRASWLRMTPGVAPGGPEQVSGEDGEQGVGGRHVGGGEGALDRAVEGEVEVRARVAVGDGEDVERVDLGAAGREERPGQHGPPADRDEVEQGERPVGRRRCAGHRTSCSSCLSIGRWDRARRCSAG